MNSFGGLKSGSIHNSLVLCIRAFNDTPLSLSVISACLRSKGKKKLWLGIECNHENSWRTFHDKQWIIEQDIQLN